LTDVSGDFLTVQRYNSVAFKGIFFQFLPTLQLT